MTSPSNELEAVNTMLSIIGESPVNSIEDTGVVDAVMARQILRETSREVQGRGWHFNTEKGFPITPTYPEKELRLPLGVLRADTVGIDSDIDVTVRGRRLYDRRNHTYAFDKGVKIDLVIMLNFDDLPEPARNYITVRAGRIFQERVVGASELSSFTSQDEARALLVLQEMESDTADYNMLTESYSVARVLHR